MAKKEDSRVTMAEIRVIQVQGTECQELQRLREKKSMEQILSLNLQRKGDLADTLILNF